MNTPQSSPTVHGLQTQIEQYKAHLAKQPPRSPQKIRTQLSLGKLYERAGETARAIQEFAKVALWYGDQGDVLKAIAVAQMIAQLDPQNEEILERLKELFMMRQVVSANQLQEYQEVVKYLDEFQHAAEPTAGAAVAAIEEVQVLPKNIDELVTSLKQVALFGKLSVSELRGVATHSTLRQYSAAQAVIAGGNQKRSLFVILTGQVNILGQDRAQQEIFFATLGAGHSFGEFALFGRLDPTMSVVAVEDCRILEIPRDIILKLAKMRPAMVETLKEMFRRRLLENALTRVPLFSQIAPTDRQKIIKYFKPRRIKPDTILMREGEVGDCMYVVVVGEVGVYTFLDDLTDPTTANFEASKLLLATLKSGDFFGEQALVTENPRSATVITHSETSLLQLATSDFQAVIKQYPWIETELQIGAFENQMRKNLSILNQIVDA